MPLEQSPRSIFIPPALSSLIFRFFCCCSCSPFVEKRIVVHFFMVVVVIVVGKNIKWRMDDDGTSVCMYNVHCTMWNCEWYMCAPHVRTSLYATATHIPTILMRHFIFSLLYLHLRVLFQEKTTHTICVCVGNCGYMYSSNNAHIFHQVRLCFMPALEMAFTSRPNVEQRWFVAIECEAWTRDGEHNKYPMSVFQGYFVSSVCSRFIFL